MHISQLRGNNRIYFPSHQELAHLVETAKNNWPKLTSRIQAAAEIIQQGDIRDRYSHTSHAVWNVHSQNPDKPYTWYHIHYSVLPNRGIAQCDCRDYWNSRRLQRLKQPGDGIVCDRVFCKHNIAFWFYHRLLHDRINYHIQNATAYVHQVGFSYRLEPMTPPRCGLICLLPVEQRHLWRVADADSLAIAAHWLGRRQDAGLEPPTVAPDRTTHLCPKMELA